MTATSKANTLDWEVRRLEQKDRAQLVALFCDADFMAGLSRPLNEAEAHYRFSRMFNLAKLLPYAEQPIFIRGTNDIIGYTGASLVRLTDTELGSFDDSKRTDLAGFNLELNCRLVDKAQGLGIGPSASFEVLNIWKVTSERNMLARPNRRSKKMVEALGFENVKRVDSWELWKLEPHRLQKPRVCGD